MMIKAADPGFTVWQIGFLRSLVGLLPLAMILTYRREAFLSLGWPLLCLRGAWGLLAMVCYFVALRSIPLADAALLNFSAPVFTSFLAVLVLREKLSRAALGWLALAMAGLWVGLRPSWQGSTTGYAIGLGAGVFSAAAFVTVKAMAGRESPWRIVFYFNAVAALALLPAAAATWRQPTLGQAAWLAAISIIGTAGQVCLTLGYERVRVSSGSVATLLAFVFAAIGGRLFWQEGMDDVKLAGMTAVVVAIVGLAAARTEPGKGKSEVPA
ncbi:MAG: DMT family transporter [Elusimicrobiota bacterium]|nr:MAG: DMT family transporter [Elusimicrobiota bacterium]